MNSNNLSRRTFIRNTSLVAAGTIAGALAGQECNISDTTRSGKIDTSKILNYNPKMGYRRLGKTGLIISEVRIGGHGLSAGHANDEDIGATPPDISFKRDQVNTMCLKCHKSHDITPEEVGAGKYPPVCSDCHGTHKINHIIGVKL